uniref:Uncharacterized protein n=1 Tax=viral metagenome TaxID=1070528 RepID=A0A6H1ZLL8_9ZZZZ
MKEEEIQYLRESVTKAKERLDDPEFVKELKISFDEAVKIGDTLNRKIRVSPELLHRRFNNDQPRYYPRKRGK